MVALENRMCLDVHLDVKVARGPAIDAGLAFAGEAHAIAFVDAGRDLHGEGLLHLHAACAAAGAAGIGDDAAAAVAARASLRDREGPLRDAHLSGAAACGACLRLGARL